MQRRPSDAMLCFLRVPAALSHPFASSILWPLSCLLTPHAGHTIGGGAGASCVEQAVAPSNLLWAGLTFLLLCIHETGGSAPRARRYDLLSYCCQTVVDGDDLGACTYHALTCGEGAGLFFRVRECQVLFVAGKTRGCFYPPPYLDDYGETDQGLKRGNPLRLCSGRYLKIQRLWRQHALAEVIAHAQEANQTLAAIDWQHL